MATWKSADVLFDGENERAVRLGDGRFACGYCEVEPFKWERDCATHVLTAHFGYTVARGDDYSRLRPPAVPVNGPPARQPDLAEGVNRGNEAWREQVRDLGARNPDGSKYNATAAKRDRRCRKGCGWEALPKAGWGGARWNHEKGCKGVPAGTSEEPSADRQAGSTPVRGPVGTFPSVATTNAVVPLESTTVPNVEWEAGGAEFPRSREVVAIVRRPITVVEVEELAGSRVEPENIEIVARTDGALEVRVVA